MLRTDTGNFNRFISSVGLLLLIAALLVPYFYFRDTDVLRISRKELDGLTLAARDALETRQNRTADLEVPMLIFAGALAIGGCVALWSGGRRLRSAQDKEDDALERKAKRDEIEFQRLSGAEIEEKREAEVRESPAETDAEQIGSEQKPSGAQGQPSAPVEDERKRLIQTRAAIIRVEETIRATFDAETLDGYEFRYEVKVLGGAQQLRLDGIFRSRSRDGTDVILELKVVRRSRALFTMIRQFTDRLIALVTRYRDVASRNATGWLVVVIPEEVEDLDLSERRGLEDKLENSLVNQGKGSIVYERDIKDLPQRFSELFGASAK